MVKFGQRKTTLLRQNVFIIIIIVVSMMMSMSMVGVVLGQPSADYAIVGDSVTLSPWSVYVDPKNRDMYIAEDPPNRVTRYTYPYPATVTAGSAASVLGGVVSAPTNATFFAPQVVEMDAAGNLWVADTLNWRVLRFTNAQKSLTGGQAEQVLGQQDFTSRVNPSPATPSSMWAPAGIAIDGMGRLWVMDTNNLRALRFDNATSLPNGSPADVIIGGKNYTTPVGGACIPPCLLQPTALVISPDGSLFIADQLSSRVLQYSTASSYATGLPDAVLDLSNFCGGGGPAFYPNGIAFDSVGNLYMTDNTYSRLIMYQGAGFRIQPNMVHSFVWGQADVCSPVAGSALNSLNGPIRLHFDSKHNILWVADQLNYRVLGFNTYTSSISSQQQLQVTFLGKSAAVVLLPRDKTTGQIMPQGYQVLFQPSRIEERDSSTGAVVTTQPFPPYSGYTATTAIDAQQTQYFNFSVTLGSTSVVLEYALYLVESSVESAGVTFTIPASGFKMTIHMSGWVCASAGNSLHAIFDVSTLPNATDVSIGPDAANKNITDISISSTNQLLTVLRLLNFAEVDGSNVPIAFSFANGSLVLKFPCFTNTLRYDPDFSVTLDTGSSSSTGGGGGDGGSSNDSLVYLALIAIVVVPIALVLLAAIIAGVAALVVYQKRRGQSSSINFGPEAL